MTTDDELSELLGLAESTVEVDAAERARARAATLQAYADARHGGDTTGRPEIVRLTDDDGPATPRWWLAAAAVLTVIVGGLVVLDRSDPADPSASPVVTPAPTLQIPMGRPIPPAGEDAPAETYDARNVGLPFVVELRREMHVAEVADRAVVLELPDDPGAGQLIVTIDAEVVGADDIDDWVDANGADVQTGFVTVLDERTEVIDILGTPDSAACAESSCPLVATPGAGIVFDTTRGTLTQVIVGQARGRPIFVIARDATPILELHAEAFAIARSLEVVDGG